MALDHQENYNLTLRQLLILEKKIDRHLKYIEEKTKKHFEMIERNDEDESPESKYTAEEIKEKLKIMEQRRVKYEKLQEILEESSNNEISTVDFDARLMDSELVKP